MYKNIYEFIELNNIGTIYLDIDGVLFHSTQAIVEIINTKYGTHGKAEDVISWDFKEIFTNENRKPLSSEQIEELFSTNKFFDIVQPIKGSYEFLNKFRDKIILVTKCNTDNFVKKREWFDTWGLKDIPIIPLPLNCSKSLINMSNNKCSTLFIDDSTLFIDDSTTNLKDSNATYRIQFREYADLENIERQWQSNWNGKIMYGWDKPIWE